MADAPTRRRARTGGRAGAASRRGSAVIEQMPWNPPVNIDRPTEPLGTHDLDGVQPILTLAPEEEEQ